MTIATYFSDDDLSPEEKALSERLRRRAEAQGCRCRPAVTVDTAKYLVVVEHHPDCPAWQHPSATPVNN